MGTPKRTSILLDLRTTLATITVGNGYNTTLVTIDDGILPAEDVPESKRPYVGWATGIEVPAADAFNSTDWRIPVVIVGYVWTADSFTTRSTLINNLMDDLIAALHVDPTRGGYAMSTWIRGCETNESDKNAEHDGWLILDMEIEYERTTDRS